MLLVRHSIMEKSVITALFKFVWWIKNLSLKKMKTFDPKTAIKNVSSYSVNILCFYFVSWQSFHCITKYNDAHQGTELSLQYTANHQFPTMTICEDVKRYQGFNLSYLNYCGIR